jgi:hypothetical protein
VDVEFEPVFNNVGRRPHPASEELPRVLHSRNKGQRADRDVLVLCRLQQTSVITSNQLIKGGVLAGKPSGEYIVVWTTDWNEKL